MFPFNRKSSSPTGAEPGLQAGVKAPGGTEAPGSAAAPKGLNFQQLLSRLKPGAGSSPDGTKGLSTRSRGQQALMLFGFVIVGAAGLLWVLSDPSEEVERRRQAAEAAAERTPAAGSTNPTAPAKAPPGGAGSDATAWEFGIRRYERVDGANGNGVGHQCYGRSQPGAEGSPGGEGILAADCDQGATGPLGRRAG